MEGVSKVASRTRRPDREAHHVVVKARWRSKASNAPEEQCSSDLGEHNGLWGEDDGSKFSGLLVRDRVGAWREVAVCVRLGQGVDLVERQFSVGYALGIMREPRSGSEVTNSLQRHQAPMLRHLAHPLHTRGLVARVSREAHAESPSIILRMRPVTCFRSASISASERGGSNT